MDERRNLFKKESILTLFSHQTVQERSPVLVGEYESKTNVIYTNITGHFFIDPVSNLNLF
jgi:hypothetical protein